MTQPTSLGKATLLTPAHPPNILLVCTTRDLVTDVTRQIIPAGSAGGVVGINTKNQLIIQFPGIETVQILSPDDNRIAVAKEQI